MPRYYDIDKLTEMIQAKADTLIEGKEAFLYVAKWLDKLPAADVVPRAVVERLQEYYKRYFDKEREIKELQENIEYLQGKIDMYEKELIDKYTKGGEGK